MLSLQGILPPESRNAIESKDLESLLLLEPYKILVGANRPLSTIKHAEWQQQFIVAKFQVPQ